MKKSVLIKRMVLALMLVSILALVSCGFKGCNKDEPLDIQAVEQVLEEVMYEIALEDSEPNEVLIATESRCGFEVVSYSSTESGVIVTFLVYAPDLYTVAKEIDENYVFETKEELIVVLVEAIGKASIVEQEITIEFEKTEDGYVPLLTEEFFDAYYGGVLKLLNELMLEQE